MSRQLYCSLAAGRRRTTGSRGLHRPQQAGAQRYEALGRAKVFDALFPRGEPQETAPTNLAGATLNAQLVVMGLMKQTVLPHSFYTQRFESH